MIFEQEIELDGVYYLVDFSISADYSPGEKQTYDNPGEDPYVDIWGIEILKVDGRPANEFTFDLLDKFKSMLDYEKCEEDYAEWVESFHEVDDDRYERSYYDPDESI